MLTAALAEMGLQHRSQPWFRRVLQQFQRLGGGVGRSVRILWKGGEGVRQRI